MLYFFNSKDIKHELHFLCQKCRLSPDGSRSQRSVVSTKSSNVSSRYRSSLEAIYTKLPRRQASYKRRQSAPEIKTKTQALPDQQCKENTKPVLNGFLNNDIHPNAVFKIKHSSWNGLPSGYCVQTPAQYVADEAEMSYSKSLTSHPTEETEVLLNHHCHTSSPKLSLPANLPTIQERSCSSETRSS